MMTKTFPVHALLSIYDGHLAGPFTDCHALIEHLVGEPCWTHQLPVIMRTGEMQADLLRQYPALADLPCPDLEGKEQDERERLSKEWAQHAVEVFGEAEVPVEGGMIALLIGDVDRDKLLEGKKVIGVQL
jgi:hypothetical protein